MPKPPHLPRPDTLDLALSEILGDGNSYGFSAISTVYRYLHNFHLNHQFEPNEILFEAYLRGKDTQRRGQTIHNPHAWLKRTAFNIVREKSRKARQRKIVSFEENDYWVGEAAENTLEALSLQHEVRLLYKALREFEKENPEVAQLLYWRTIEQLSWTEIEARLRVGFG